MFELIEYGSYGSHIGLYHIGTLLSCLSDFNFFLKKYSIPSFRKNKKMQHFFSEHYFSS